MAFDSYELDDSFNTRVRDSLNSTTNTANSATVGVDLDNVGNVDDSTNGSYNATVDVGDSFNEDSHDVDTDVDADIEDSFNDESDNSTDDHSDNSTDDHTDNSIDDSYNDQSDNSIRNSYNDKSQNWTDDHSVNVGVRSYNVGGGGGGGGGGGPVVIVDQSINSNVKAWGDVDQEADSRAVVASGDGAMAAGDDIDIDQDLDASVRFEAGGDVNIGNTTTVENTVFSNNTTTDDSSYESTDVDVDIDDSFNDSSAGFTVDNSFNAEIDNISESTWDVDANVIWGSEDAIVVDDVSVDLPDV